MNKNRYITVSSLLFLFFIIGIQMMTGCKKQESEIFFGKNSIYFPNENGQDTLRFSFSHYPGTDKFDAEFQVILIGDLLTEDKEYKIRIVDTLTTALPTEYKIISSKFRAGLPSDSLYVQFFRSERMKTQEVKVVFEIEGNDNFDPGYFDRQTIQIVWDAIESQPAWWTKNITDTYLGVYSSKKLETFIKATGVTMISADMEIWEKTNLCRQTHAYILANGITEEDGSPMIIVRY